MGPIAFGRREICVPDRALTLLSREQQQTALAHELAHLIRRDPFWLVFGGFLESLFFFQPLIRVARKEMRESAEYLCDDWAVRQTGGNVTLAKCLAEVASWNNKSHAEPIMASGMAGSPLVRRIQRLLDDKEIRATHISLRGRIAVASGLLGLVLVFAPGISTDRFEPEKSNAEMLISPADLTDWVNPGHEQFPPMTSIPFEDDLGEVEGDLVAGDEEDAPESSELLSDPTELDQEASGPEEWSPLNLLAAIAPEKLKEENDRALRRRVARDLKRAVERSQERSAARSWDKVYSVEPVPLTGHGSPEVPAYPTTPKTIQVPRPIIGVYTEDKKDYNGKIKGLVITDVMDGMPAKIAGIHTGDVIIAVDGQKPASFDLLKDRISHHGVDGGLMLTVARKNEVIDVLVTIGTDGKMIEVPAPAPSSEWRLAQEQQRNFGNRYAETVRNATDAAAEYRAALDLAAIAGNESQFNNQKVLQKEVKDRLRQMYEQQKLLLETQQAELEPLLAAMQNGANENGELDIQIDMEDLDDLKEFWNDLQVEIENFGEYLESLNLNVSINNENHPEHPFGSGAEQSYGFSVGTDEDGHSVWDKINGSQNSYFYSTGQHEDDDDHEHEHEDDHDHDHEHEHDDDHDDNHDHDPGFDHEIDDFEAWYEQEAADRLGAMLAQAILDQGVKVTRDMEGDLVDVVEHAVDHVLEDMSSSVSVRARVMRLDSSQTRIRSLLYKYFQHAASEDELELSSKDHDKVKKAIREVVKQLSSNGMQVSW
ncbi:MAG: PDZ domain-containing protein [Candidatus Eisenbacteria bacterium]|uniref:PDZ domain-containing protein n=1 Tax=Eiseniibacteriota bacterium TaxID=2212470 RepID=A0A7Y2E8W3_UNCEI|nr:PDZ domain-containing protein [Candidatus Eisenbacteria bacterium]